MPMLIPLPLTVPETGEILDFLLEADKLKFITRQTYLSDGKRKENDGEHSWHLALMAVLLSEYSNEKVDLVKVITMVLIHDIVEIDAGDTYAYDAVGNQSKREREVKAADRIFNILPEDQAKKFRQLWEEFEAYETPEAKFAHVCDNVQPLMLNDATDGLAWREHDVKKSQVLRRNSRTGEGSQVMMEYINKILDKNVESGNLRDE